VSERYVLNIKTEFEITPKLGMVAILNDGWRLVGSLEYAKESGHPIAVYTMDGWKPCVQGDDGTWRIETKARGE
jgi:hypothetical protein